MNHAFIIQIHTFPEQFGNIVRLLASPNHFFFINVDKKVKDIIPFQEAVKGIPNIFFLQKRISVTHGGFSQIECTLSLLEIAYNTSIRIDYFHSLSGMDYPCLRNEEFDKIFENSTRSYMFFDAPELVSQWRDGKYSERVNCFDFRDIISSNFLPIKASRIIIGTIVSKLIKRNKIENLYAGWSWFSWHRNVVEYVFNYLKCNPKYYQRFRYTWNTDELIFHTILFDQAETLNIEKYDALRFIVWNPKRETKTLPLILDEREYTEILESGAILCRKIHPELSRGLIKKLMQKINTRN